MTGEMIKSSKKIKRTKHDYKGGYPWILSNPEPSPEPSPEEKALNSLLTLLEEFKEESTTIKSGGIQFRKTPTDPPEQFEAWLAKRILEIKGNQIVPIQTNTSKEIKGNKIGSKQTNTSKEILKVEGTKILPQQTITLEQSKEFYKAFFKHSPKKTTDEKKTNYVENVVKDTLSILHSLKNAVKTNAKITLDLGFLETDSIDQTIDEDIKQILQTESEFKQEYKKIYSNDINELITLIQKNKHIAPFNPPQKGGDPVTVSFFFVAVSASLVVCVDQYIAIIKGREGYFTGAYTEGRKLVTLIKNKYEEIKAKKKQDKLNKKKQAQIPLIIKKLNDITTILNTPEIIDALKEILKYESQQNINEVKENINEAKNDIYEEIMQFAIYNYKTLYVPHRIFNILKTTQAYKKFRGDDYIPNYVDLFTEIKKVIQFISDEKELEKVTKNVNNVRNELESMTSHVNSINMNELLKFTYDDRDSLKLKQKYMEQGSNSVQSQELTDVIQKIINEQNSINSIYGGYEVPHPLILDNVKSIYNKLFDFTIEIDGLSWNKNMDGEIFEDIEKTIKQQIFFQPKEALFVKQPDGSDRTVFVAVPVPGGYKRTKKIRAEKPKKDSSKELKVKRRPTSGNSKKDESQLKKKDKKDKKKM